MILDSPAKLNLWLRLTGVQRSDGRHELRSHFAPLNLCDKLILRSSAKFGLSVSGPFSKGVPTDEQNLVYEAFRGFCATFGLQTGLHIHLKKNIPSSAGLGGGSSNAGTLLRHLAETKGIALEQVRAWSLCLGADVPAAVGPHSGLVEGVGEVLGAAQRPPDRDVLLVKPKQPCPTSEVFAALNEVQKGPKISQNDLEMAACMVCPDIEPVLTYLRMEIDPKAQITGSGSTCYALVPKGFSLSAEQSKTLGKNWVHQTTFRH